jgi:hypothetical protein
MQALNLPLYRQCQCNTCLEYRDLLENQNKLNCILEELLHRQETLERPNNPFAYFDRDLCDSLLEKTRSNIKHANAMMVRCKEDLKRPHWCELRQKATL